MGAKACGHGRLQGRLLAAARRCLPPCRRLSGLPPCALAPPACLAMSQDHYPWFLPTYLSYPYNIQRVDVLRYFILHKLGGIYIDLE